MNSKKSFSKIILSILTAFLVLFLLLNGAESFFPYEDPTNETNTPAENEIPRFVVYEAVFISNEEAIQVFQNIRRETPPYENIPSDYHVTCTFRPETDSHQLYGTDVVIHGYLYKAGETMDGNGDPTGNEGVLVNMSSANPGFQNYIDNIRDHVWHITGSYAEAPKFTSNLDFSDGTPVNFTITGKFGAQLSDRSIVFSPEEAESFLNGSD